jgi:hypothetical protein
LLRNAESDCSRGNRRASGSPACWCGQEQEGSTTCTHA